MVLYILQTQEKKEKSEKSKRPTNWINCFQQARPSSSCPALSHKLCFHKLQMSLTAGYLDACVQVNSLA